MVLSRKSPCRVMSYFGLLPCKLKLVALVCDDVVTGVGAGCEARKGIRQIMELHHFLREDPQSSRSRGGKERSENCES